MKELTKLQAQKVAGASTDGATVAIDITTCASAIVSAYAVGYTNASLNTAAVVSCLNAAVDGYDITAAIAEQLGITDALASFMMWVDESYANGYIDTGSECIRIPDIDGFFDAIFSSVDDDYTDGQEESEENAYA